MTSIVFLHGATSDPQEWHYQIDALKSQFDCHAPDLTRFNSIDDMADHVLTNAPNRFVLCGASMGGYVSLAIMRKAAQRVEGLILLNTSGREDTAQRKAERLASLSKTETAFNAERSHDSFYAAFLAPCHASDSVLLKETSANASRAGFSCSLRHQEACMNRRSTLDILPSINVPTLVVGGRDDRLIPPECQKELHAGIPRAELLMLDNCGHLAHLEWPELINKTIERFILEKVSPSYRPDPVTTPRNPYSI